MLKVQLSLARCSDKALEHFINVRGPVLGGLWVVSDEELEGNCKQGHCKARNCNQGLASKELQARTCKQGDCKQGIVSKELKAR